MASGPPRLAPDRPANSRRLLIAWAIVSILWVTLYVAVFSLARGNPPFERIWADLLTPPALLLIVGGMAVQIARRLRRQGPRRRGFRL